jgi:hypothetical protein
LWHHPLNGSDTIQKDFFSGILANCGGADEMEWAKLIEIFSLCNQPYDGAYSASPPTADSIRRIDQVLKVTLASTNDAKSTPSGTGISTRG